MSDKVYKAVTGAGIKCAHVAWPVDGAPELPYAVYLYETENMDADGSVYANVRRYSVEFYQKVSNSETEKKLEAALSSVGPWDKNEMWLESENCLETVYSLSTID